MKLLQILSLAMFCAIASIYPMEQPNSILACVCQSSSVEQACEQAVELLKKQPKDRKITTNRFLLESQKKFHRSMYEVGFTMASLESVEISTELAQEAKKVWDTKPTNLDYATHLFRQEPVSSDKIPSFLFYIYTASPHCQQAAGLLCKDNFIAATLFDSPLQRMPLWIDSGILQKREYLSHLFRFIISSSDLSNVPILRLFHQVLNAGYNPNVTIDMSDFAYPLGMRKRGITYLPTTALDLAIETKVAYEQMGAAHKTTINNLVQIIRALIKAGAKSTAEL